MQAGPIGRFADVFDHLLDFISGLEHTQPHKIQLAFAQQINIILAEAVVERLALCPRLAELFKGKLAQQIVHGEITRAGFPQQGFIPQRG